MIFSDRAFLGNYSTQAMNVAAMTFNVVGTFIFFFMAIAAIAEVLAGQYNGEKRFPLVGRACWQLLWFSLGTYALFVPLAFWGKPFLVPDILGDRSLYFEAICFAGPLWSVQAVFSGFFASTGRAHLLLPVTIAVTTLNLVLDYWFIFGGLGLPAMGATGAGLATAIAQFLNVAVLFVMFLKPAERSKYNTGHPSWFPAETLTALKIGTPNAFSHSLEVGAWAFLYWLSSGASVHHLTLLSVVTAFFMLFGPINEGLKQGAQAIASNLIGKRRFDDVQQLLMSGIKILVILAAVSFVVLVWGWRYMILLMGADCADPALLDALQVSFALLWVSLVADGVVWVTVGILTSGGDTRIPMLLNIGCVWCIGVLPAWIILGWPKAPLYSVSIFACLYTLCHSLLIFRRYRQGHWRNTLTQHVKNK